MEDATTSNDIDLSRAPLGVKVASALAKAVAASDDRVERHYLEVKSDLNLTQKNDIAKIAKFILGAANRLPSVASSAFEGYGVMVIGVASGDVRGVPPVEVLELDQTISRYIGTSGPRWDVVRVPVPESTNEVLVVVVDPPRDGQDPFPCRKEGEKLFDGRIYVRADGATREAKAEELELLIERGRTQLPEVNFEVEIVGVVHPVEIDESRTLDAYIATETRRLLDALPGAAPSTDSLYLSGALHQALRMSQPAHSAMGAASSFMTEPESRTEEEYRNSISQWEDRVRAAWRASLDDLAGYVLDGVSVRVSNAAKVFLHDVEVKVHLAGQVRGIGWREGSHQYSDVSLRLPSTPREWGPRARSYSVSPVLAGASRLDSANFSAYRSPLDWDNSGSIDMTLEVGELRPKQVYNFDDDELVLVLPGDDTQDVRGTWEITARDHNEIYAGELSVAVGDVVDLTDSVRKLLSLD